MMLESLEHIARIVSSVQQLGGAKTFLQPDQIEKLLAIRERLGLIKPGDREAIYSLIDSRKAASE